MSFPSWSGVARLPPSELGEATLQLHWAAQYVASAGQTFAEPRPDDSHRAMSWDPRLRAFIGDPFAGVYPFRTALRPEDLTLLLIDRTGGELGSLPLAGKPREEGFEWLSLGVATYLGGAPPMLARPEYDMPDHPVRERMPFSTDQSAALEVLTSIFGAAATLLEDVREEHPGASPVLCWPHHFDIATLLTLESDDTGQATRTIGVGMAPSGGGYAHWYWYVNMWPAPEATSLPTLGGPGAWHTDGWIGAVLTSEEILRVEADRRSDVVKAFVDAGIEAAVRALDWGEG